MAGGFHAVSLGKVRKMLHLRRFASFTVAAVVLSGLGAQPCLPQWDVSQTSSPTKQYVDPAGEFVFDAPAKWQVEAKADSTVFHWDAAAVTLFRRPSSSSLPQLTADVINRVKSVASGFQEGTKSNVSVAGKLASSVEFTAKGPNGENTRGRVIAIADSAVGLAVLLTTPLADFDVANGQLVAPLGLLINGRDVSIKKGTEFVIYVSADTMIDVAKAKHPTVAAT